MEAKRFSKRQQKEVINNFGIDKQMPAAIDLEDSVLGALLIDKLAIQQIRIILFDPEIFYESKNEIIYKAICDLSDNAEPVDLRTVTQKLRKSGELEKVGGAYYISQLTFNIQSAANLEYHSRILVQYWMKRLIIKTSLSNASKAYQDDFDVFEILDKSLSQFMRISEKIQVKPTVTAKQALPKVLKEIEAARQMKGLTGIPSGFSDLDKVTGGWQPSDLIIIAGRPAMGKTTFALSSIKNSTFNYEKPGIFISLEMPTSQLITKLISCETRIPMSKIRKGYTTDSELEQIIRSSGKFFTDNLLIDDTASLNLIDIKSKITSAKAKSNIEWAVIDYLQLISNPGHGNREQEISSISRGLKQLAKELNIPIIALSQLSRSVESRNDKRPQLSDLRESGAIEQDADMVCFLFRPEYYEISEYDDGTSTVNTCEVIIAKNRNGPTVPVRLHCELEYSHFADFRDTKLKLETPYNEKAAFSLVPRNENPMF
jgi:replicative DNA helicase